jgi:hypothetical protein
MKHSLVERLSRAGNQRRKHRARKPLTLEHLESRLTPSVDVLTYHNDIASTGLNDSETELTPANVRVGSFGKLYTTAVDGNVYAQPLLDTGVAIANGPNTHPGAAGIHDVVFVATEHDSLYAIDASSTGGSVLWQRTFLDSSNPNNNTLNATAITSVPSLDTGSDDLNPEIGITGTPVIDPAGNILYVVVMTKEMIGGNAHYVQRLHAINIADGTDLVSPYLIGDTTNTNTNNTQIYVFGNGDGTVTDPYNGTGHPVVQFNALRENERGALNLMGDTVYVEWASFGDAGPYHGWVVAWDVTHLTTTGWSLKGVLNASPNGGSAGIWQSGGRLDFEADGSAFYFATGNGNSGHGNPILNSSGFPSDGSYYEAVMKVVADTTTTPANQNINGWGFKVADYFIPFNQVALDEADSDFGAGGPTLLPDSAGIPGHPHLLVVGGKEGKLYVVDRDNMGKFDSMNDHVLNSVPDGSGHLTPPNLLSGSLSTPAYYNSQIYWIAGYGGSGRAFGIQATGTLSPNSQTSVSDFGYLPGSPSISANGATGGIVWLMDRNLNAIHAYDASTLATELWNSSQRPGGLDSLGAAVKFAVPIVANGLVYVGTSNSLVVYGLVQPPNAVPDPPSDLAATVLSGTSVNLTWNDTTASPNMATAYAIDISTDGTNFTPAATAPAAATSVAIGALSPLTKYYFRIHGLNSLGNSVDSNIASATTTNEVPLLDFSNGFAGSGSMLTYNGSAVIQGSRAELTNSGLNEAGSFFSTKTVDISRFSTQFTLQIAPGVDTADGMTFTIQGVGPTALGNIGGGLGYGSDNTSGPAGIGQSAAIKFDLYSNQGEGPDSTGLYTNGAAPTNVGSIDLSQTGIDLHSGDLFLVSITYDGTSLGVTITDTVTNASATQNYTIDIVHTVGASAAYVGFTGGTGGLAAVQDVLTWTFSPDATSSPFAPSGLGATPASATSVKLTWTNNATNETGFQVDRAVDVGFTQSLITLNLPAGSTSYTDTATGLVPGSTFYYRIRAVNAAGPSGNSNIAQVTIPLAPARPTNAVILGVSQTEIDISWTDNAGHTASGYRIDRRIGSGTFTTVAVLPPTSRRPPSTYFWSDTGLTPGTAYEYHISAFNVSGANDSAGVNAFTIPSNLFSITTVFTHSYEFYAIIVSAGYQQLLRRSPDSVGLANWVVAMQSGLSTEQLDASFVSSPEYIANHGGVGATWVAGIYQDLLNRTPQDAEVNGWLSSGLAPYDIAIGIATSIEHEVLRIVHDYTTYLGRAASEADINGWLDAFTEGVSPDDAIAYFVSSAEYYLLPAKGNDNNSDWVGSLYHDLLGRQPSAAELNAWLSVIH